MDVNMIKGIAHICLSAVDLEATERFYCEGLGCEKAFDFIKDNVVFGFYLQICDGCYIEVFRQDTIQLQDQSPVMHFCLEVEDIEKVAAKLNENGYQTTPKKMGADNSWQMWTTDPSGVKIEFHQYTEISSQKTHENCIIK